MQAPPTPSDEAKRLEVVNALALLDTDAEERLDAVTRIARRLFGVPIALVTLVDEDRQWFKSNQGMAVTQTPRRTSFCGHAILADTPLVVPDTHADERFADNPHVTGEPGIRFYAGAPLMVSGQRVGSLWVIDRQPRTFGADDIASLKDLATIVTREMASLEMATIDELTGLHNRRGFIATAKQTLEIALREGLTVSLAFFDINGLKAINDTQDHAAGDAAIQRVAATMEATFRGADVVARLAGDEFVVLLHNTSAEQAPVSIERLRHNLRGQDAEQTLPLSSGVVTYDPKRHADITALIAEADQLMYEDKQRRRDRAAGNEI